MTEDIERQLTERNTQKTPEFSTKKKKACELAGGSFTAETEVLTTAGLTPVTDLSIGQKVYALDPISRIIKLKPVTAVQTVPFDGRLVTLEARRVDIQVAPDHRIPYRTKADSRIRFKRAGNLDEKSEYKFINSWRSVPRKRLEAVNITDFVDEYEICVSYDGHGHTFRAALPEGCEPIRNNGHTGYHFDAQTFKEHQSVIEAIGDEITIRSGPNHHRRPYRFDGDDFIELLGWFITEGSVYWSSSSDTAQVKIAQKKRGIVSRLGRCLSGCSWIFTLTSAGLRWDRKCSVDCLRITVGQGVIISIFQRSSGIFRGSNSNCSWRCSSQAMETSARPTTR